jgi:hypothetical protein
MTTNLTHGAERRSVQPHVRFFGYGVYQIGLV